MNNKVIFIILTLLTFKTKLSAQCAMCKAVVEANLKEGGSAGAGLNEGILYLMAMPYIAVLLFGIFYYFQKNKKQTA
jgi:hypothetical protein